MTPAIESTVSSWPGVEAGPHRFGGREFTVAGTEIGHLHGDRQADIPFPKRVRDVLVAEGLTSKHHLFPESGWVTKYLRSEDDVEETVWLFRIAYLYRVAALHRRTGASADVASVDVPAELDGMDLPPGVRESFPPVTTGSTSRPEP
jgi:hypothetical protein